jgi:predicted alpha/beta hydrolase
MPTITHNGVKIAYDSRGKGRPAFVFIHGWTCDRSCFAPQAKHFARRHRVVSVDLRGHGQSDKPQGPYPISNYVDDIAFLIDTLRLGKVVAVGHSMGGITALSWPRPSRQGAAIVGSTRRRSSGRGAQHRRRRNRDRHRRRQSEPRRQFIADALFMRLPTRRSRSAC